MISVAEIVISVVEIVISVVEITISVVEIAISVYWTCSRRRAMSSTLEVLKTALDTQCAQDGARH